MTIELNLPHTIEEIKDAFNQDNKELGCLKAEKCMCYIRGICELSNDLKKDGRLDSGLINVLDRLIAQSTLVMLELFKAAGTKT